VNFGRDVLVQRDHQLGICERCRRCCSLSENYLTKYVIDYYGGFMTRAEWLAYRSFLVEGKIP